MFTRVKMRAEVKIHRSVYASVVRSRAEKDNKKKNVSDFYAAKNRASRK